MKPHTEYILAANIQTEVPSVNQATVAKTVANFSTPRTDAEYLTQTQRHPECGQVVKASFAQSLEREITQLRDALEEHLEAGYSLSRNCPDIEWLKFHAARETARRVLASTKGATE